VHIPCPVSSPSTIPAALPTWIRPRLSFSVCQLRGVVTAKERWRAHSSHGGFLPGFWPYLSTLAASALIFWRAMLLSPQKGLVLFCLFFTVVQSGFLGVLLTLSERLWAPAPSANAGAWELTPIEDQQLAGLIMWVPAGLFYTGAALWVASAWIKRAPRGAMHLAYVRHHDISLTAEGKVSHGRQGPRA
jgi:hypothetical protein